MTDTRKSINTPCGKSRCMHCICLFLIVLLATVLPACAQDLSGLWENDLGQWQITQNADHIQIRSASGPIPMRNLAEGLQVNWDDDLWLRGVLTSADIGTGTSCYHTSYESAALVNSSTMLITYQFQVLDPDTLRVTTLRTEGELSYIHQLNKIRGTQSAVTDYVKGTFVSRMNTWSGEDQTSDMPAPATPVTTLHRISPTP